MNKLLITRLFCLSLTTLCLNACETSSKLPEPSHTPQVALFYSLSNQDTSQVDPILLRSRQLYVSASQRVFDPKYPDGRADATVEILDAAGTVVERFAPTSYANNYQQPYRYQYATGYYVPTLGLVGEPGATYTLRATVPGLPVATSTVQLPAVPVIKSASFTPYTHNGTQVSGRFSITLADDPTAANYYLVSVRATDAQGRHENYGSGYLNTEDNNDVGITVGDFRLSQPIDYSPYGPEPYPDTNANGQEFTLSTNCSYYNPGLFCGGPPNCSSLFITYLEVRVSSITAEAYRFYQSQQQYFDNRDNPFAEPTSLLSNITPGYGLFGGSTDAIYRIKL